MSEKVQGRVLYSGGDLDVRVSSNKLYITVGSSTACLDREAAVKVAYALCKRFTAPVDSFERQLKCEIDRYNAVRTAKDKSRKLKKIKKTRSDAEIQLGKVSKENERLSRELDSAQSRVSWLKQKNNEAEVTRKKWADVFNQLKKDAKEMEAAINVLTTAHVALSLREPKLLVCYRHLYEDVIPHFKKAFDAAMEEHEGVSDVHKEMEEESD